ncbi:hypothetical protein [Ponticoccus alexandrii]|nr:hypothetical protein [Ponticoccus alexandrii]
MADATADEGLGRVAAMVMGPDAEGRRVRRPDAPQEHLWKQN